MQNQLRRMVDNKLSDLLRGALCRAQSRWNFARHTEPGNGLSSRSHHAADCHIVCFRRDAARGVGYNVITS